MRPNKDQAKERRSLRLGSFVMIDETFDGILVNVVSEMICRPMDFDSWCVGKEVFGVVANRLGKFGISMIWSSLIENIPKLRIPQVSQLSFGVSSMWTTFTQFWSS